MQAIMLGGFVRLCARVPAQPQPLYLMCSTSQRSCIRRPIRCISDGMLQAIASCLLMHRAQPVTACLAVASLYLEPPVVAMSSLVAFVPIGLQRPATCCLFAGDHSAK